ncbi:DUF5995 family protein [Lolliginicoccus levis]|uniref:DUF5995 family protein n=1 Tax=Lolliginicoccus levis TaxID=2919542 RepID=UPI00241D4220|nr:DUF5995 family protein [Lolliginicoccus levis]
MNRVPRSLAALALAGSLIAGAGPALADSPALAGFPAAGALPGSSAGTSSPGAPSGPCASHADDARLAELSDPARITGSTTLERLEDAAARHSRVTALLESQGDRRGLFSVGLDAVEQHAVLPMQRDREQFVDPQWANELSLDLLERYLANLHARLTGGVLEPQWERFFDLAEDCSASPAQAAMAGYNAHLTVDLARAVSAAGTRDAHVPDFFRIVDAIALRGDLIIDRTRAAYGADLGPLWRGYVVGPALDSLVGEGVGTTALLRFADVGYNSLTLAHGLALQEPMLAGDAERRIAGLWSMADDVLAGLRLAGGL